MLVFKLIKILFFLSARYTFLKIQVLKQPLVLLNMSSEL